MTNFTQTIIKRAKREKRDPGPVIRVVFLLIASILIAYVTTIPYRNYLAEKLIGHGEELIADRKYADAHVSFLKASLLFGKNKNQAIEKMALSRLISQDILNAKEIIERKNPDLFKIIEISERKLCDLENNKLLIEKGLPEIAVINLKFCTEESTKNYSSYLLLGEAYWRLSENDQIFKEHKPEFRDKSLKAFEGAYFADPIKTLALEKLIELNKIVNNKEKVDYWQRLLDNLNSFSK